MSKYTEVERRNKVYKYFVLATGTKRGDITWCWIVLCNTELYNYVLHKQTLAYSK